MNTGRGARRVAIVQSNYLPWKGYFDLINAVDECILLDDVQYTRSDWRNRNRIKTPEGTRWLTIPVQVAGRRTQSIRDAQTSDPGWAARHWATLRRCYGAAPAFGTLESQFAAAYADVPKGLAEINRRFIDLVCSVLNIGTRLSSSADYRVIDGRNARLVDLCRQAGATEYLSGPSARVYLDEALFREAGVTVRYVGYDGYPEYPQLHGPFEHTVSIADLLFSVGADAPRYMRTFVTGRTP